MSICLLWKLRKTRRFRFSSRLTFFWFSSSWIKWTFRLPFMVFELFMFGTKYWFHPKATHPPNDYKVVISFPYKPVEKPISKIDDSQKHAHIKSHWKSISKCKNLNPNNYVTQYTEQPCSFKELLNPLLTIKLFWIIW